MANKPFEIIETTEERDITTLLTDYDHVCVSNEEYTDLVKARVSLDVLKNMYAAFESYDYEKVLRAFFGEKPRKDDA